jgi:hypothetical protein
VVLAGCSGSDDSPPSREAGVPVRLADCTHWRDADPRERRALVRAVRDFAGGPSGSPGGRGATLPDSKAYTLFDSYCENRFARGFKLYKLYTRAASFGAR